MISSDSHRCCHKLCKWLSDVILFEIIGMINMYLVETFKDKNNGCFVRDCHVLEGNNIKLFLKYEYNCQSEHCCAFFSLNEFLLHPAAENDAVSHL